MILEVRIPTGNLKIKADNGEKFTRANHKIMDSNL
jgi:hypothetical protein